MGLQRIRTGADSRFYPGKPNPLLSASAVTLFATTKPNPGNKPGFSWMSLQKIRNT